MKIFTAQADHQGGGIYIIDVEGYPYALMADSEEKVEPVIREALRRTEPEPFGIVIGWSEV